MNDRFHVATRKGLFTLDRQEGGWKITQTAFMGNPVTMVLHDRRERFTTVVNSSASRSIGGFMRAGWSLKDHFGNGVRLLGFPEIARARMWLTCYETNRTN